MPESATAAAAPAYCALGIRCFLTASDGRTPIKAEGWFEHGVHDATADAEELAKRFAAYPHANISFACGPASGFFVVDLDIKGGKDGLADLSRMQERFGRLPDHPVVLTPSGGQHHYFRHPVRPLRNRVGLKEPEHLSVEPQRWAGVDIRAAGGSACAPPSRRHDGSYCWVVRLTEVALPDAPNWLLAIIDPPEPPRRPPVVRGESPDRISRYVERAIDDECAEVGSMSAHSGRNQRLFLASLKLGQLVGAKVLPQEVAEGELEEAARKCGLVHDDGLHAVQATIASGMRAGLSNPRELDLGR